MSLGLFQSRLSFPLDAFQLSACQALDEGRSVLVAAPTGAGKTVVAEYAVHLAMAQRSAKVFYTAPIKALSNQKFQELVEVYGADAVGLLTGDTNINSRARIVVMTTEVLRNMLYADSDLLPDLRFVIMDEVHYLADRFRGAVWEEVIIHLPSHVRLVSLSATVSNAEEFGDWLQTVRGDTAVIVSEDRPVPLEQHILMRSRLIDLFDTATGESSRRDGASSVNPELIQLARYGGRALSGRQAKDVGRMHSRGGRFREERLDRAGIVKLLDDHNLLPAIAFIFSRKGCDQAVQQVLRSGIRLTTVAERDEIREYVEQETRSMRGEDLAVLGYPEWLNGLERGVAAHHAGLFPAFKEIVEELFRRKLLRVVFATETLALGINMPARTVVLEALEKFNGEARVPITPGEYTQLTGRAGRRGIDVEGHAVIQWKDGLDPGAVASLASRRTYPLNSSFKPTYNMSVNLIEQFGRDRTREILESSFAQFQADRGVVDLARKVREHEGALEGYASSMTCHLGDFAEYAGIRREISDLERKGTARSAHDSRAERDRRQQQLTTLRKRLRQHPCHGCADREAHARWAERWWRLKREADDLRRQIVGRTGAIAKVFDRVSEVLLALGYLTRLASGDLSVAASGRALRRIYGERDLLVAECLRLDAWEKLEPNAIAAMAATIVHEPRRDSEVADYRLPKAPFRAALDKTNEIWERLDELEHEHRLPGTDPLSAAMALPMWRWANGANLESVLDEAGLQAGDFVRLSKQAIDLLDQVSIVAEPPVDQRARRAIDLIRRGIVAYSSVS
ncbi:MAG: DEAD/DEAH box helicase [Cryobacterium sp.]|nr:DEAD/DEAH box helicase [Cryobacterium sp.]